MRGEENRSEFVLQGGVECGHKLDGAKAIIHRSFGARGGEESVLLFGKRPGKKIGGSLAFGMKLLCWLSPKKEAAFWQKNQTRKNMEVE